jgi:hypothetical protein
VPHQQAGHMTAPDQCCINVKKLLSIRRRPHMTLSGYMSSRNSAAQRSPPARVIVKHWQQGQNASTQY